MLVSMHSRETDFDDMMYSECMYVMIRTVFVLNDIDIKM